MGKSKLEFYAKITTSDGREITKRVEEEIPELDVVNLEANHSITVECGWEGPFYLSPTKAVCNYLHVELSDHYLLRLDYYGYLLYFCWCHFPLVKWGKMLAKIVIKMINKTIS